MKRLELLLILLCGLLVVPCLFGFQHSHEAELPDVDKRKGNVSQFQAEKKKAIDRLRGNLPDLQLELDEITGAPKSISSRHGFLTDKNGIERGVSTNAFSPLREKESHGTTRKFLREHPEVFGHGPEALDEARVKRDYVTRHNGLKTTVWQQELDGIPVFEALLVSHVTKDNELVNLSSRFVSSPNRAAERGVNDRKNVLATPPISAKRAITIAAASVDTDVETQGIQELGPAKNEPRRLKFQSTGLAGETYVELAWLPLSDQEMRLCWQVILSRLGHGDMFLVLVDAQTGELLVRRGLTRNISEASYNVFTAESPTPMSPGHSSPLTNQPALVSRQLVTLQALNTNASPLGWINDDGNTTLGNNVEAHLDRDGNNNPDLPRPQGSPNRVFDATQDLEQEPVDYGDSSVVQLFYWCNWMHDKLYELGFTEDVGNFQHDNFNSGGQDEDPVLADAQDNYGGTSRNNSNFSTPPDGMPGRMQVMIYNRSGSEPDRDAALDAQIVLHEYTHGMSDRLVGGGMGMTGLQSRGMAEGWSDFFALALLSNETNDVNATYPFGAYVARKLFPSSMELNYYFGTRRYPYSTDLSKNPLTFKDIDPNQIGFYPSVPRASLNSAIAGNANAVHNQGEIWCVTLWEARANLIVKHGFATGNQLILQLVTDGMKLCPPNPTFLQARDEILRADLVSNGGANHPELWAAFAKRGMGFFASAPLSNTTAGVVESFALPDNLSILPDAGLISSGSTGGPFLPNAQNYVVTNIGSQTITWSLQNLASWLNASTTGGSLAASNGIVVALSIKQSVAGTLPVGIYTNTVIFTNETTGIAQSRDFVLRIGQPDTFTELFNVNDLDLAYQSFTFTPDDSSSFYSVCREVVTNFYSDPIGGTPIPLTDDDSEKITVPQNVAFYGDSTLELFVGSNGYITFGAKDERRVETVEVHFMQPRISALFNDLVPPTNSVSWKAFTNRVAVTYSNVTEYGTFKTNSFQIELFYDSRIRITYLNLGTRNGLAGLSRGTDVPTAFVESTLSSYPECAPAVQVSIPSLVSENDGTVTGEVAIHAPLTTNLTVNLFSSDNAQATVPLQVSIPAEQTSVSFNVSIIDDEFLDGTQPVTITASASGYQNGRATMRIDDNETGTLVVVLPDSVLEGGGIVSGTVFIQDAAAAADIQVQLESQDPSRLTVPASVVIAAGQNSANFPMTILDNQDIDGDSVATVTANVAGWTEGTADLPIIDDEDQNLRLQLPTLVREGNGNIPRAGIVRISGRWTENVVVGLSSDSPGAITAPEFVVIPAGSTFVTFDLTVGNDSALDGLEAVQLTAIANEFVSDQQVIEVEDDETPLEATNPRPAHLSQSNPVTVDLEWDPTIGEGTERLTNGGFELGTIAGWTSETNAGNGFSLFTGSYTATEFEPPIPAFKGGYSLAALQSDPGTQTLFTDFQLPTHHTATLGWTDLVRNDPGVFTSNHCFRVELRNTNNVVLSILYSTLDNSSSSEWTTRTFNISHYAGETVRLAFVIQTTVPGLNVFLDDISLRSGIPPETTYDVYFGTNTILDASNLLGSTTNTVWDLPVLEPFTTYFWKIVSRRTGEVSSPIWEFRTLPTLSVENIVIPEGHTNLTAATFVLSLSSASGEFVSVDFTATSGSAFAEEDFVLTNGVVEFAPGETNKMVEVYIVGDPDFEEHETFTLVLSNPQNCAIANAAATCTILDDDSILAPISNKVVNEGSALTFTAQAGSPGVAPTTTITDFEIFDVNSGNGTVLFRDPRFSSSTSVYLGADFNGSRITNSFPSGHSGSKVLAVSCNFNGTTNPWVRLTTTSAASLPSPTISFNQALQFDIYTDRSIKLGLGVSETGTTNTIGTFGGTSSNIEFVGVTNKLNGTPRPTRTISAGAWQRVVFNIPAEPVTSMFGNGVLDQSTGKGVLEHLGIVPNSGSGIYNVYLDNFAVVYTNQLTFTLSNAPAGATINPFTGVFTWTPTEAQGPGVYTISVNATDGAGINETRTFTVTVNDINTAPLLSSISNKTIPELTTLTNISVASDSDIPANTLTFSLDSAPFGASIDPVTGVFTWTPTEARGPSTNTVTIRVTDNGSPNLSATRTFFVFVTEVNNAPILTPIADRVVYANSSLTMSATAVDHDVPANVLTFSIVGTPPPGVSIHPSTGIFSWPNITAAAGSTNLVTIRVQDNGAPSLSASQTFALIVVAPPIIQSAELTEEGLKVSWSAIPGQLYRVQYTTTLHPANWQNLGDVTAQESTASLTEIYSGEQQNFYRILVLP